MNDSCEKSWDPMPDRKSLRPLIALLGVSEVNRIVVAKTRIIMMTALKSI